MFRGFGWLEKMTRTHSKIYLIASLSVFSAVKYNQRKPEIPAMIDAKSTPVLTINKSSAE